MSYRQFLFLISCVSSLPLEFALSLDNYLHLLEIYSAYNSVRIWTHFVCYRNDENIRISSILSASSNAQTRFITNFDRLNDSVILMETTRKQGFVVDTTCHGFKSIFNQKQQHRILFNGNNLWLFLYTTDDMHLKLDGKSLTNSNGEIMSQLDMLPNSEVVMAQFDAQENKWTLYDVYKVARNQQRPLVVSVLGWINDRTNEHNFTAHNQFGLRLNVAFRKTAIRENLQGIHLRCGSHVTEPVPFTYLDDDLNMDQLDIAAKSTLSISRLLREDLNFSCDIVKVNNYELKQSALAATMALYREDRIDTLVHAEIMRPEQLQYAEFTADIFSVSTPIIFRQPPLSAISNILLLPLDKMVWYCYAALILCVIFIMGIQIFHPMMLEAQITLFDVVSFVLGSVCQQGTHLFIPSLSGRFVLITTFVATLAIFTSYSASIVALLQSPSESIDTLASLLESPLTLGFKNTSYINDAFFNESQTYLKRVHKKKNQPFGNDAWISDVYIGIDRVRTELFAFLVDAPSAYNAISRTYTELEKCRLSEISVFPVSMNTISVARNSGYKELIKRRLLWMHEIGLIYRTKVKWLPRKPSCEGDERDFSVVGFDEILPIIYAYTFGAIISIAIFSVEICSSHWFHLKKIKHTMRLRWFQ